MSNPQDAAYKPPTFRDVAPKNLEQSVRSRAAKAPPPPTRNSLIRRIYDIVDSLDSPTAKEIYSYLPAAGMDRRPPFKRFSRSLHNMQYRGYLDGIKAPGLKGNRWRIADRATYETRMAKSRKEQAASQHKRQLRLTGTETPAPAPKKKVAKKKITKKKTTRKSSVDHVMDIAVKALTIAVSADKRLDDLTARLIDQNEQRGNNNGFRYDFGFGLGIGAAIAFALAGVVAYFVS